MTLPVNFTNDTPSHDQHPGAHNQTNTKVNTIQTDLDTAEAALAALTTQVGNLPKGRIARVSMTVGSVTQGGAGVDSVSPSLTFANRKVRLTVAFVASATGAITMNVTATAPGVAATLRIPAANIGTGTPKQYIVVFDLLPNANGTVTVNLQHNNAQTATIDATSVYYVDDMGA